MDFASPIIPHLQLVVQGEARGKTSNKDLKGLRETLDLAQSVLGEVVVWFGSYRLGSGECGYWFNTRGRAFKLRQGDKHLLHVCLVWADQVLGHFCQAASIPLAVALPPTAQACVLNDAILQSLS